MPTERERDAYLKRSYGITLAEYNRILARQGGGCAGCKRVGVTRSLHVDHDHKSGAVRGILCAACNSALRKLKDSPEIATALAGYLREPPAQLELGRVQIAMVKPRRRTRRRRGTVRVQAK